MANPSSPGSLHGAPAASPEEQRASTLAPQTAASPRQPAPSGPSAATAPAQRSGMSFPDFSAFAPKPDALARGILGKGSGEKHTELSALISKKMQEHQSMHADLFKSHADAFKAIASQHGTPGAPAASGAHAASGGGGLDHAHAFSSLSHTAQAMHESALNKINRQLSELKPVSKWKKT